jgi:hypothetical protein
LVEAGFRPASHLSELELWTERTKYLGNAALAPQAEIEAIAVQFAEHATKFDVRQLHDIAASIANFLNEQHEEEVSAPIDLSELMCFLRR